MKKSQDYKHFKCYKIVDPTSPYMMIFIKLSEDKFFKVEYSHGKSAVPYSYFEKDINKKYL